MTNITPQHMPEVLFDAEHYDKYGDPYGEQTAAPASGNGEPEAIR